MLTARQIQNNPILLEQFLDDKSKYDLATFTSHILGFDNAAHHYEWYKILQDKLMQDPHGDWDSPLIPAKPGNFNRLISILAPRSHSKSTSFTVNYPLWRIGRDPNIRILLVSAAFTQSVSFLREIKGHMERNPNYHRMFGNLSPENLVTAEKWASTEIIVRRDNTKIKDPTVAATSTGGTVLSKRADLIICDDILDEQNTRTAEQRAKTKEWFDAVLLPVLEPDGQLIIVGTAWNREDLYHQMMQQPIYDIRKRYKAILDDDKRIVLWPERWSYDSLMKRKEQTGGIAFNKSYQNEAIAAEDAIFKQEWTDAAKAKGRGRKLLQTLDYSQWDLGKLTIAAGVDLAISKKDGSDFTAMSVVGCTREGEKVLLYAIRDKLSPAETRQHIIEIWERFRPEIIIVENNAYQEALRRDLADTTAMPIKGYTTGGEKFDQEIGINSLAVEFENGKWILPYDSGSPQTVKLVDYLVEGMLDFPSGHTEDLLMATWFANNGLRDLMTSKGEGTVKVGTHSLW